MRRRLRHSPRGRRRFARRHAEVTSSRTSLSTSLASSLPTAPPLLLATRSEGKLRELLPLLERAGFRAETLASAGVAEDAAEDALEIHETFEENALAKARWFASRLPGRIVLADDSGLVVPALGGAPGVRSKRWANAPAALPSAEVDAVNNAHLLRELERVERSGGSTAVSRAASYVCVAAAVCVAAGGDDASASALAISTRGETAGVLLRSPHGSGGFGYDPYFMSTELAGWTFAEVSRAEKERVSHRGRAFRALLATLSQSL